MDLEIFPHEHFMQKAFQQAQAARELDEVPVGAIIQRGGRIIGAAHNLTRQLRDPTAHAEMLAITQAAEAIGDWRLNECTLYVTLEPCPMCAGAIVQSRIKLLVFGADDPKTGAVQTVINIPDSAASNHKLAVLGGVESAECTQQLQNWFAKKRRKS